MIFNLERSKAVGRRRFYPALTGSNTPTSKPWKNSLGGGFTARKCPISATNTQWGENKNPH